MKKLLLIPVCLFCLWFDYHWDRRDQTPGHQVENTYNADFPGTPASSRLEYTYDPATSTRVYDNPSTGDKIFNGIVGFGFVAILGIVVLVVGLVLFGLVATALNSNEPIWIRLLAAGAAYYIVKKDK